jgi:hypothetical protein
MARDYKREYEKYHGRPEQIKQRAERVKAQRLIDKTGVDRNKNGKADAREGKDIDHKKPLRSGGTSDKSNLRIRSIKANRGENGR